MNRIFIFFLFCVSTWANANQNYDAEYFAWKQKQKPTIQPSAQPVLTQSTKIYLNSASLAQLTTLDGIGQKKAQAIIDYRQAKGGFKTIEEIQNIQGIGAKIFQKNQPKLAL